VLKVPALIGNVSVCPLKQQHSFTSSVAALLPPRHLALTPPQSRFGIPVVAGVLDLFASRERGEGCEPHVDSNCFGAGRERVNRAFHAEGGEPSTRFPFDCESFDIAFQRPVQVGFDVAYSLNVQFAVIEQSAAIAIGWKRDAVVTSEGFESWKSRLFAALYPAEESLKRPIYPAQHIPSAIEIWNAHKPFSPHWF
jgi:hypothetical protein